MAALCVLIEMSRAITPKRKRLFVMLHRAYIVMAYVVMAYRVMASIGHYIRCRTINPAHNTANILFLFSRP